MSQTHTPSEYSPDDDDIYPLLVDAPDNRGQHDLCKNFLLNSAVLYKKHVWKIFIEKQNKN